ncbi:hypothetical protein P5V15_010650 [Pogonomyrmex californicus]
MSTFSSKLIISLYKENDLVELRFKRKITKDHPYARDRLFMLLLIVRIYVGAIMKTSVASCVLSSVGTLLLVFVLSTTTLAHRHRPVLLPTPRQKNTQKSRKKKEMKMKQH